MSESPSNSSSSQGQLVKFTWSRDSVSDSPYYPVTPQSIIDLFAAFDPNLIVKQFSCEPGTAVGDNYASCVWRVDVDAVKSQESAGALKPLSRVYNLMVKVMPTAPARIIFAKEMELFVKETVMYGRVLPELTRFEKQVGIVARDLWLDYPLYFGGSATADGVGDYLAVENLAPTPTMAPTSAQPPVYAHADCHRPIDCNHIVTVMRSLGKFHAVSYTRFRGDSAAILARYPELADRMWSIPGSTGAAMAQGYLQYSLRTLIAGLNEVGYSEDAAVLERTEFEPEVLWQRLHDLVGQSGPQHAVIGHGDLWINNMLFKYAPAPEGDQLPIGVKFIDWQASHPCSRAVDLQQFLMLHNEGGEAAETEYLRIYYDSLVNHAMKLGYFPAEELTFAQVREEYEGMRLYGFVMALTLLPIMYADSEADRSERGHEDALEEGEIDSLHEAQASGRVFERIRALIKEQLPKIMPSQLQVEANVTKL